MRYNIWLSPHLPTERNPEYFYWPRTQNKDTRLNYLDKEVYTHVIVYEQEDTVYDLNSLLKKIKTHPDKDDAILDEYLKCTGKNIDKITQKELKKLPTVPLTLQEVQESLDKLEQLGYIKK